MTATQMQEQKIEVMYCLVGNYKRTQKLHLLFKVGDVVTVYKFPKKGEMPKC